MHTGGLNLEGVGHAKDCTSGGWGDASPPACRQGGWADHLRTEEEKMVQAIRRQTLTGRPSGSNDCIAGKVECPIFH